MTESEKTSYHVHMGEDNDSVPGYLALAIVPTPGPDVIRLVREKISTEFNGRICSAATFEPENGIPSDYFECRIGNIEQHHLLEIGRFAVKALAIIQLARFELHEKVFDLSSGAWPFIEQADEAV